MAWRLKHSTPKIWHAPGTPPTEPTVILDRTMDISERAARQQLAFYLQGWVEERPDDRHVTQRDGLNAWAVERPAGCSCTWCERHRAAAPEEADNQAWWRMGGTGTHVSSYLRLKRTEAPVSRAESEIYRVVDRSLGPDGEPEWTREPTVWSKHYTMEQAQRGLTAAVRKWRRSSHNKTATRRNRVSYNLKMGGGVPVYAMLIERIMQ